MPQDGQVVFVYVDWGNDGPQLMGKLHHTFFGEKWTTSFEYDNTWLRENHTNHALDPDLSLYSGRQFAPKDKSMFGIFSDSCPDRWGRTLMK